MSAQPARSKPDVDVQFSYDRFIGADGTLDQLQRVLTQHAAEWIRGLRLYVSARDQTPLDLDGPGDLREAMLAAAGGRGALYHRLVAAHGARNPRLQGAAELRGASDDLTVVAHVDEDPLSRIGGALLLNNSIALQLRRAHVAGRSMAEWAGDVFRDLCASTSPAWGAVTAQSEYWAKVMSDGPETRAVGRDFSRFLPGLFSLNFFGARYVSLIGEERLLTAPARSAERVDDGVLLVVGEDPRKWESADHQDTERAVLDHLGDEFFFSKSQPERATRAPVWKNSG